MARGLDTAAGARAVFARSPRGARPRARNLIWVLAGALVLATVLAPFATASEMTAVEYADDVAAARDAVSSAGDAVETAEGAAAVAEAVRELVPSVAEVAYEGGTVTADGSMTLALVVELEHASSARDRREAAGRLDAHLASLQLAVGSPGTPPEGDAAVLSQLIAKHSQGGSGTDEWLSDLADRITQWVNDLLARLLGSEATGTGARVVFYALLGVAAAAVLALIYIVIRRWLLSTAPRARRLAGAVLTDAPVVPAAEGLPGDVLAHAEREAAAGRYRDAVRALFGGAARSLVRAGVVQHTRTRTNAELLRDVRLASEPLSGPLGELCRVFEPAWYGHLDPGPDGWTAARTSYDAIVRSLETRDAA
jgi:hypothetical protein